MKKVEDLIEIHKSQCQKLQSDFQLKEDKLK